MCILLLQIMRLFISWKQGSVSVIMAGNVADFLFRYLRIIINTNFVLKLCKQSS